MMAATYFQMIKQKNLWRGEYQANMANASLGGRYMSIPLFQFSYLFEHFPIIKLGKTSQDHVDWQLTTKNYLYIPVSD